MAVLEHNPFTFFLGSLNVFWSDWSLALTERNSRELICELHFLSKFQKLTRRVSSGTENEDKRDCLVDIFEDDFHWDRWRLGVELADLAYNIWGNWLLYQLRSKCFYENKLVELAELILVAANFRAGFSAWDRLRVRIFTVHPSLPVSPVVNNMFCNFFKLSVWF